MLEPLPIGSAAVKHAPWHVLHRDYETRSTALLKAVGSYRYATDPTTEILCVAYAADNQPGFCARSVKA